MSRGYTGEVAGVVFDDGRPVTDPTTLEDPEATARAIVSYAQRHGLTIEDERLVIVDEEPPESPDPRHIGFLGSGIESTGTLRDAAVDPRPEDFLPPTNAGVENPHGPLVVAPEIHGSPSRPVTPGPVAVDDPDAQEAKETAAVADTVGLEPSDVLARPAKGDSKDAWAGYAFALGVDVDGLTKADIIAAVEARDATEPTDDSEPSVTTEDA